MENKKMYIAKVDDIIALCHILEDYREFIDKLNDLLYKPNLGGSVSEYISKASHGVKLPFRERKFTRFYQENKEVIDTINKYTDIGYFISNNYNWLGELREDSGLDYFHEYIMNHLEKLDKILAVLEKLKQLGFREFSFDKEKDFKNEEHYMYTSIDNNFEISYLDNIEVLPNYQTDIVKYRTTDSNYMIVNGLFNGELADYDRKIILNSLTFDAKRLPNQIDKETMFDSIVSVKSEQSDLCQKIRNSVNLSTAADDLEEEYLRAKSTIDGLLQMEDKEELYKILTRLKKNIDALQNASARYDQDIARDNESISLEQIEKEKQLYLKRKFLSSIDID